MDVKISLNKKTVFVKQVGAYECWYACYLMMRQYHTGEQLDYQNEKQTVMATATYKNYLNFGVGDPFVTGAGDDVLIGILNEAGLRFEDVLRNSGKVADEIENSIKNGKPVIVGLNRGKQGGHFIFVIGISGDDSNGYTLTYLDPEEDIAYCEKTILLSDPSIASVLIRKN